jgi:hypothetical protein
MSNIQTAEQKIFSNVKRILTLGDKGNGEYLKKNSIICTFEAVPSLMHSCVQGLSL